MTVKEKVGRRRYVALRVSPAPGVKSEFGRAIYAEMQRRGGTGDAARLMILRGDTAVVSCRHTDLKLVLSVLNGSVGQFGCRTLLVSGTVRTIKDRFGLR